MRCISCITLVVIKSHDVQAYVGGERIPAFGGNSVLRSKDGPQSVVMTMATRLPVIAAEELEEELQQCLLDPSLCKPLTARAKPPPKAHPPIPMGKLAELPQVSSPPPLPPLSFLYPKIPASLCVLHLCMVEVLVSHMNAPSRAMCCGMLPQPCLVWSGVCFIHWVNIHAWSWMPPTASKGS